MTLPALHLKAHRDEAIMRGHPWVFSRALRQPVPSLEPGALVDLRDRDDAFVARGYYNPQTDIAVRVLTRDPDEAIDTAYFIRRIQRAVELRQPLIADPATDAYRLINAEGDFLPGVIVDRYADVLVVQISTAGMERLTDQLIDALREVIQPAGIVLRNDVSARGREGLPRERSRLAYGDAPPLVEIRENDLRFSVDVWTGQKTGFFLDQREKRQALRKYAPGKTILNTFSYTGGFGIAAGVAGATAITSVDQSGPVIAHAKEQFRLNGLDPDPHLFFVGDAFQYLEDWSAGGQQWDIVVLDPPAFAKNLGARPQALRAYRRLNQLGLNVLRPGGLLVTCSCSGPVSLEEFQTTVIEAAERINRPLQLTELYTHGLDHPLLPVMSEAGYLKVLFCRA